MKFSWILIFSFLLVVSPPVFAQQSSGRISGKIMMPDVKTKKRTLRGRIYRNRLAEPAKDSKKDKAKKSPYTDVIVILHPQSFSPETTPMEGMKITQKNAEFIPHVLAITRNTVVDFINMDDFYHNVFSITPGAKFNIGRRPTNSVIKHKITRSGEIKLFCDIHSQMNAIILSLDTPYFTRADEDGSYRILNLPEGEYLVEVYHPDLPNVEEFVTITKNKMITKNFMLSR